MTNTAELAGRLVRPGQTAADRARRARRHRQRGTHDGSARHQQGRCGTRELGDWTDSIDAQVGDDAALPRAVQHRRRRHAAARRHLARATSRSPTGCRPARSTTATPSRSYDASFSVPGTGTPPPINPDTPANVSIGSLQGTAVVPRRCVGRRLVGDHVHRQRRRTPGRARGTQDREPLEAHRHQHVRQEYSDRDIAELDYVEPDLMLDQGHRERAQPARAGVDRGLLGHHRQRRRRECRERPDHRHAAGRYAREHAVDHGVHARRGAVGRGRRLRDARTTRRRACGRSTCTTAAVDTPVPSGSRLVIEYDSVVDTGVGAGATLTDIATVAYNTQADGSGRAVPGTSVVADPNTDDATVQLAPLQISKNWPAGPYTVGDTFTASIDVIVPPGMIALPAAHRGHVQPRRSVLRARLGDARYGVGNTGGARVVRRHVDPGPRPDHDQQLDDTHVGSRFADRQHRTGDALRVPAHLGPALHRRARERHHRVLAAHRDRPDHQHVGGRQLEHHERGSAQSHRHLQPRERVHQHRPTAAGARQDHDHKWPVCG